MEYASTVFMHTKRTILTVLAIALSACSTDTTTPPGDVQRANVQRQLDPDVSSAAIATQVAGNTAFATDLYSQFASADGNLFFSPFSISTALAMTYAGARGDTEQQMATALHFEAPLSDIHSVFNALDLALQHPSDSPDSYRFDITNAVFGQTGYPFNDVFVDTLGENYDTDVSLLDFAANPDGARNEINAWIADMTEARIPELFAPGSITSDSRLVLTNAVYFKAPWQHLLDPERTRPGSFFTPTGEIEVPMMRGRPRGELSFAEGDGYEAFSLPYEGGISDFVLILPDDLDAFEATLDQTTLDGILSALQPQDRVIFMPTFEFRFQAELNDSLIALGMVDAFTERADFSGMTDAQSLALRRVVHEAFIIVNESGTEATASTGAVLEPVSDPGRTIVDRPFVFLIRDIATNSVLFLGRVVDPSA